MTGIQSDRIHAPWIVKDPSFYKTLFGLAVPVILSNMITVGVNIMDTVMLGKMGEVQLSASSLANNYVEISHIVNLGIGGGGGILISQYCGANDRESIRKVVALMFRFCWTIAAFFTVLSIFFPVQIMKLYSTDADVIEKGVLYLKWILPAYILHGSSCMLTFSSRSMKKVKGPFIGAIVTFFVNIFFNWVFIFGKLGAPRMEIAGAALGTSISRLFEFLTIAIFYFKVDKDAVVRIGDLRVPVKDKIKTFLHFGLPVIGSDLLLVVGTNIISVIMGHIGTAFVAAYAIVAPVIRLSNVGTIGLSQASATVTGNKIGEGGKDSAYTCGMTCFLLSICAGLLASVIIIFLCPYIVSFYDLSAEASYCAVQLMDAVALIVLFQAISTTLTKGILRGGGDSRFVLIVDTIFTWLLAIPLGYLCGLVLNLPPFTTFVALRSDQIVKAIFCLGRLFSGKWIKKVF